MYAPFSSASEKSFSWSRYLPFKPKEKKKFLMFCFFKALLSFLFVLLRVQKKSNIVVGEGAEKIPATKTIVFLLSLFVAILYSMLSNRYRQEQLFYGILCSFFGAFLLYACILVPYGDMLRPAHAEVWLERYKDWDFFNDWLRTFVVLYVNWVKVFFYCLAELWGQFAIVLFFWGLSSEYFSREEGKRFFHFFIAAGNLSSIVGAWVIRSVAHYGKAYAERYGFVSQQQELALTSKWVSMIGAFVVLLLLICYRWVNKNLLYSSASGMKMQREKTKLSFLDSIRYVFSNPYLVATMVMILGCAVCRSLVETTAEKYIKLGAKSDNSYYVNLVSWQVISVHVLSILSAFFIVPYMMRRRGWKGVAYVTPVLEMCVGGAFLIISLWHDAPWMQTYPMAMAYFALFQGTMGTFSKYMFFDTAKEIVYTGIDAESRRKGKAAIDVVVSRMGKMLSSWLHIGVMGLFSATEDVRKVTPILLGIFLVIIAGWMKSVKSLSKTLDAKKVQ